MRVSGVSISVTVGMADEQEGVRSCGGAAMTDVAVCAIRGGKVSGCGDGKES